MNDIYNYLPDPVKEYEYSSEDLIKQAEELNVLIINLAYSSTESFKSIMLSIYSKIMTLIGAIALTFKRKVVRIFQSLKQTELEEFSYKNIVFLSRLKRANYNDLRNIKIPYPEGMISTYFDATNKNVTCLISFNMLERAESFKSICDTIYESVKNKKYKKDLPGLDKQVIDVDNIKKLFETYIKCFTNKKTPNELQFGKLFLNMQEYVSTKDLLSNNDKYQFQVNKIYRLIEDCNELMKNCIKLVQDNKDIQESITREDLISMSNACMFFAKTTDMYGNTILDFHTIEHNFVQMLIKLKKEKGLFT